MRGLRPALSTFLFLLLITGGVYPLLTTALGQWWFPWQANGSLIREGNTVRGSALIGQNFTGNGYFHGRPSASGLDNNITPQAAAWQIPRVAKARNLSVEQLTQLVAKYSQQPLVKYIGQPVVNIVELNLALDKLDE
ncbi:TPA: potassium-transporting ATPase subunit C [Escherichia albertii]|nr:potassium-transporting ATPase subunit C [Escherichia albertii]HEB1549850.1 potassium-transporting ATPase subunit C [Escherichia albertii]